MSGKWIKKEDYHGFLEVGKYYLVIGQRNVFSKEYPMLVRCVRNGLVSPVMEQYVSAISMIYSDPIEIPEEVC